MLPGTARRTGACLAVGLAVAVLWTGRAAAQEAGTDADAGTDAGTDSDAVADAGTDADTDAGTDADTGTGTDAGTGAGTDAGTGTGTGADAGTGTGTGTGTGAGSATLAVDASALADLAFAWYSDADAALPGGGHDPEGNGFTLQQFELALGAAVDGYFRLDASLVIQPKGVHIEEVYASTLGLPAGLGVRAGQFFTRFGELNTRHPHLWSFVDQPFALGRLFGPEGNRGLGLELSWLTPLPWHAELVASMTEAFGSDTARSFLDDSTRGIEALGDFEYLAALRQRFRLAAPLALGLGLSSAFGPNDTGPGNRTQLYGADLLLKYRLATHSVQTVTLRVEGFYRRREVPDDVAWDLNVLSELVYGFARRWAAGARYECGSPVRGLGGAVVLDPIDPDWTDNRHRYALNLSFWPAPFSRLRLQGGVDDAKWLSEPVFVGMLTLEVVAGVHGARAL